MKSVLLRHNYPELGEASSRAWTTPSSSWTGARAGLIRRLRWLLRRRLLELALAREVRPRPSPHGIDPRARGRRATDRALVPFATRFPHVHDRRASRVADHVPAGRGAESGLAEFWPACIMSFTSTGCSHPCSVACRPSQCERPRRPGRPPTRTAHRRGCTRPV